jgi:hypothetical protein
MNHSGSSSASDGMAGITLPTTHLSGNCLTLSGVDKEVELSLNINDVKVVTAAGDKGYRPTSRSRIIVLVVQTFWKRRRGHGVRSDP